MYLFALCDLFYISIVFRFDGFIFTKDFHEVEYSCEVECTTQGSDIKQWNGKCIKKISMMKLKGTLMQI